MKAPTREQIIAKIAELRKQYNQGKLTPRDIEMLEAIPGWTWDETGKVVTHA